MKHNEVECKKCSLGKGTIIINKLIKINKGKKYIKKRIIKKVRVAVRNSVEALKLSRQYYNQGYDN